MKSENVILKYTLTPLLSFLVLLSLITSSMTLDFPSCFLTINKRNYVA